MKRILLMFFVLAMSIALQASQTWVVGEVFTQTW